MFTSIHSKLDFVFTKKAVLIGLILIACLIRLSLSVSSIVHLPASSDEASAFLLAEDIAAGERPLLFVGQPYQFPVEAYLLAPVVNILPHDALGARAPGMVLTGLAAIFFFLSAQMAFPATRRWGPLLIILFPSSYMLLYNFGYRPPQYSAAILLASLSLFFALKSLHSERNIRFYFFLSGLFCGLGISNHVLTISFTAGIGLLVIGYNSSRYFFSRCLLFPLGIIIGAIPYLLAKLTIEGAYKNIPDTLTLAQSLNRVYPTIKATFGGAMGFNFPIYPDHPPMVPAPFPAQEIFVVFFCLLMVFLLLTRSFSLVRDIFYRRWPRFEVVDFALVTTLATLVIFCTHPKGFSNLRYVLPAVWVFPFLIGFAFCHKNRVIRGVTTLFTLLLVLYNFTIYEKVLRDWRSPGEIAIYADHPDIRPLIDHLHQQNITHCYASFWLSYRITFETERQIICSMWDNSRFKYWPLPFIDEVNSAGEPVFVLYGTYTSTKPPYIFRRHLVDQGLIASSHRFDKYTIFTDIRFDPQKYKSLSGEYSDEKKNYTFIQFEGKSTEDQRLEIDFGGPKDIQGLTLLHAEKIGRRPENYQVWGEIVDENGEKRWQRLTDTQQPYHQIIWSTKSGSVYGHFPQFLDIQAENVAALRIEAKNRKPKQWEIEGIDIRTPLPNDT